MFVIQADPPLDWTHFIPTIQGELPYLSGTPVSGPTGESLTTSLSAHIPLWLPQPKVQIPQPGIRGSRRLESHVSSSPTLVQLVWPTPKGGHRNRRASFPLCVSSRLISSIALTTVWIAAGGVRHSEVSDLPKCPPQGRHTCDARPWTAHSSHLPSRLADEQKPSPRQHSLTWDAFALPGPAPDLPCPGSLSRGPGTTGQQREALLGAGHSQSSGSFGSPRVKPLRLPCLAPSF